jgi:hypothetical protein
LGTGQSCNLKKGTEHLTDTQQHTSKKR